MCDPTKNNRAGDYVRYPDVVRQYPQRPLIEQHVWRTLLKADRYQQ